MRRVGAFGMGRTDEVLCPVSVAQCEADEYAGHKHEDQGRCQDRLGFHVDQANLAGRQEAVACRFGEGIQGPNTASACCSSMASACAKTSGGTHCGNGTTRVA